MPSDNATVSVRPVGVTLLAAFFAAATAITALAGASLLWPGFLSAIWTIKPAEHAQLARLAPWSGLGFLVLSPVMATAAVGLWRRGEWGRRTAVAILAVNGAADLARLVAGDVVEGLVGVVVAGLLVWYLCRRGVRAAFAARHGQTT